MGIRNPLLTENDLDPNATNATRLDALRTLFEIGVSYDQRVVENGVVELITEPASIELSDGVTTVKRLKWDLISANEKRRKASVAC